MALARASETALRPEPTALFSRSSIGENAKIGAGAVVHAQRASGSPHVGPQAQPIPRQADHRATLEHGEYPMKGEGCKLTSKKNYFSRVCLRSREWQRTRRRLANTSGACRDMRRRTVVTKANNVDAIRRLWSSESASHVTWWGTRSTAGQASKESSSIWAPSLLPRLEITPARCCGTDTSSGD